MKPARLCLVGIERVKAEQGDRVVPSCWSRVHSIQIGGLVSLESDANRGASTCLICEVCAAFLNLPASETKMES
jgi:hypothetical protein